MDRKPKISYIEVPGSKYTTIQLETPAVCTIRDINTYLCHRVCQESSDNVNNPHQSAYFAFLIMSMRQAIQMIKKKRDNPISLAFSVNDGLFIISISFLTDTATFRLAVKTIATNYFPKTVS